MTFYKTPLAFLLDKDSPASFFSKMIQDIGKCLLLLFVTTVIGFFSI